MITSVRYYNLDGTPDDSVPGNAIFQSTDALEVARTPATADIVSAIVRTPGWSGVLINLICDVREALAAPLDDKKEPEPVEIVPAVPVRQSVKPDTVTCLYCGTVMQSLKRHIGTIHGQSPEEYRKTWGLAHDHPIVAPNYSARRSALAKEHGLGRK